MNGLSIIELLLASFSMLCVLRLFVVVFLGDGQAGPVISRVLSAARSYYWSAGTAIVKG